MNQTAAILTAENLSFSYGNKRVLQELSLALYPGQFSILLGPNGAGKTTLFGLLTGLLSLQEGHLTLGDVDLAQSRRALLDRLGVVFQQSTLDLDLSVSQNLRYHAALRGMSKKEATSRIDEELERFELSDRANDRVRQLNGGHRRRVELARALLHHPQILLLDEPTVGLDSQTRARLNETVRQRCADDKVAVLWATHLMEEVSERDPITLIHRGKTIFTGDAVGMQSLTGASSLTEAFDQLTKSSVKVAS